MRRTAFAIVLSLPKDFRLPNCPAYGVIKFGNRQSAIGNPPSDPLSLGRQLQADIWRQTGLSVSVGLGANRMLAKLASKAGKPGGVVWVEPGEGAFLADLPIESLLGVGHKTARLLADLNIQTVADLRRLSREALLAMLGGAARCSTSAAAGAMRSQSCRNSGTSRGQSRARPPFTSPRATRGPSGR